MKPSVMFICAAAGAHLLAFDASECGFSPEASGKDNTAALQRAFDRGGTVTVDRPGRYKIADTVFIGDDNPDADDSFPSLVEFAKQLQP